MNAEELRTWRGTLGLNQTELAAALGVPVNAVWRWEHGQSGIRHPVMLRLALERLADDARRTVESGTRTDMAHDE